MIREVDVLKVLPTYGFLPLFVSYGGTCTDAPLVYHIGGALSVLTQTAPMNLCVNFGSPMYANMYTLVVGPSSVSRKSATISIARGLLDEAIPGCIGEVPGSEEGLVESLRDQPRQLICYSEFGQFLSKTEQGYMMPLKTRLNDAWDCAPMGRALAKKRSGPVNNARLSILAGSTPGYLERHTEPTDWLDGFMARWLTFLAERERTFPMPMEDAQKRAQCIAHIQQLAARPGVVGSFAGFDPTADKLWNSWYQTIQGAGAAAAHEAAGQVARAPSFALKIAMLLSWDCGQAAQSAMTGAPWQITCDELEPAIAITDLHLKSVTVIAEGLAESRDMRERRQVLMSVGTTPVTVGEISRKAKLLKRRTVEIIDTLLEEQQIQRIGAADDNRPLYTRLGNAGAVGISGKNTFSSVAPAQSVIVGGSVNVTAPGLAVAVPSSAPSMEDVLLAELVGADIDDDWD